MSAAASRRPASATVILFVMSTIALGACSSETGVQVSPLTIGDAPPGSPMRAAYVTLTNHDASARTLSHATSTAYDIVEFHRSETVDGLARMRQEHDLLLPAKGELRFEPYGRHLMLMRPTALADSEPLVITLCFANGECLDASTTSGTDDSR